MVYVPKKREIYIDVESFKKGLYALEDTTKAPLGSFSIMQNVQLTDRGGVAPRYGTELLGTANNSTYGIKGFYNFKKSFGEDELLIKCYDDEVEVYSKTNAIAGWSRLKSGFTQDKEFGFVTSLVNTENQDYVMFCNRYDPYQRWSGATTLTNGAVSAAAVAVTVDSTLTPEIFYSGTATANSATTIDVAGSPWAASQYVNMYVHIVGTGKVRKITANTANQITFDTLGAGPGNVAFQIRQLAFPATGTIIYNGTTIAYTGIDLATAFTVASAHAAPDDTLVTLVPTEYLAAPRGNRLANYLNRIIVGNVRSAMARDTGGALQGYSSAGSYFVSKVNTPTDFGFSSSRAAGEGDIVSTPYGGGDITDIVTQEDSAYVFKREYVESVKYSQDSSDLAVRVPLKAGIGSVGKTIRGQDDIYFVTDIKEFTSLGRVKTVDVLPQTKDLGYSIKRLMDTYNFDDVTGMEYKGKVYIAAKSSDDAIANDIVIIYSRINKAFEGVWDIPASGFANFDGDILYSQSNGADVFKLFTGTADVEGTTRLPIAATCQSHFINLTASKLSKQALNSIYFEGYIAPGSTITFKAFKDFETSAFMQFDFSGTEDGLIDGSITGSFLGSLPLGVQPLGAFSTLDSDGRRHFQFRVYFPFQYGNYFSVGWESVGTDLDYEITRYGLGVKEDMSVDTSQIKSI